ncbi:hypothetical protein GCM10010172_80140 [Paractinoplanes ferrugineus]|uniref:Uncharacterized protein n=1 Tax=Paractinoplanes ferrugineus TaxID=113564 RepID=A0A919JAH8_9ACTN|nr:hypothetical protein [Actinoplanes ferrugineus]GIE16730.1 hypothetical protein Afe05nite_85700 [Actinoplanes ferrugineus]
MSRLEQFIIRHKLARYAFVLISWPFEAVKDRVMGVWNPVGIHELRTSLAWARWGGDPSFLPPRPEAAPISEQWQR